MGLRFRKSKKVGPFRVNISQKGVGWSVGVPGLRYTKKAGGGSRVTASVPGTGISYVKESGGSNQRKKPRIAEGNTAKLNAAKPSASRMPVPSPELTEPQPPQNGGKKNRTRLLMVGNGNIFLAIFPIRLVLEDRQVQAQKACKSFCPGCSLGNSSGFLECFFYRVQSGSVQLRGVFRCIVFCASFGGRKRTRKPSRII